MTILIFALSMALMLMITAVVSMHQSAEKSNFAKNRDQNLWSDGRR